MKDFQKDKENKMEKLTKEELEKLLNGEALGDEELEKISGGNTKEQEQCIQNNNCRELGLFFERQVCIMHCLNQ